MTSRAPEDPAPQPTRADARPPLAARLTARVLRLQGDAYDVARLLGTSEPDVAKRLRAALARSGGREAVFGAGLPELARRAAAAFTPPDDARPSTGCAGPDVLGTWARGALDGPLLLATVDHAADCDACVRAALSGEHVSPAAPVGKTGSGRGGCLALVVLALAGTLVLVGATLLRPAF